TIARSWFAYAQEPIPDPDKLPGSTQPITDRAHQRKPKQISAIIFRNHPALAQSNQAERLQQEGWFDNEMWLIRGWFPKDQFTDHKTEAKVGDDRTRWSLEAWANAHDRWRRHGEENHLLYESPDKEAQMQQMAEEFSKQFNVD